jgi:hypothetical protein
LPLAEGPYKYAAHRLIAQNGAIVTLVTCPEESISLFFMSQVVEGEITLHLDSLRTTVKVLPQMLKPVVLSQHYHR